MEDRPWLKDIPLQMDLFGLVCPFCDKEQSHMVSMVFAEGTSYICESCRRKSTLGDFYAPPTMEDFKKRLENEAV